MGELLPTPAPLPADRGCDLRHRVVRVHAQELRLLLGPGDTDEYASLVREGLSSSTVNVLWGAFNLAVGYVLILHVGAFDLRDPVQAGVAGSGALANSLQSARHFGQFHATHIPIR